MPGWGVIPSIRVRDMAEALDFYQHRLGFNLERGTPEEPNCSLTRGDARIMLEAPTDFFSPAYNEAIRQRLGGRSPLALYIEAEDLDAFYTRLQQDASAVIADPLADRPWGQREFTVEDLEGNWLTFWRA